MRVLPFKISKPINSTIIVQEDKALKFYDQLHQHEEIQISLIVRGQGKLVVANTVHGFTDGSLFVIGGNTPHIFQNDLTSESAHMITVFVTPGGLGQDLLKVPELKEVRMFLENCRKGFEVQTDRESIAKTMLKLTKTKQLDTFLHFLKLIQKINSARKLDLIAQLPSKKISNKEGRRLQLVFEYVLHHFSREITLEQVAGLVHMTTPAFCRFFKRHTNKTFFEFLIAFRIAHACQLLAREDRSSIAEIAESSGFNSISNFNRKFKKTKSVSPSQYAREMRFSQVHQI
ncbi:helix-turn-helix domain-containing protein [Aggregatimonas sangjinii]|uniref:Helix-turn-helix domain-containing protein n=1 Tax=Aggregatimonas sangjinii TaxID=2583587 RepID=A0A5B7SRV3_9FLAO|nr:AraC family transcriptional regulator [Aggregatimonas sangjinii]QCW99752.1 helix-turn-helix domain-containing protein [Aggregatimonas sangjinii]